MLKKFLIENSEERFEICKKCDSLNSMNFCTECACFMPAKVKLKNAFCPLGKWGEGEIKSAL
jgi:hypothetical protein